MAGIAPGRYSVRMPGSNGQWKEPTEVNLESGGELDVSPGRSTSQIKLAVQIEGAPLFYHSFRLFCALAMENGLWPNGGCQGRGSIFRIVIAGTYDILAAVLNPTLFQWFASLLRLG